MIERIDSSSSSFSVGEILIFVPHRRRRVIQLRSMDLHLSLLLSLHLLLLSRTTTNRWVESLSKIFINLQFFTARRHTLIRRTEIIDRLSIRRSAEEIQHRRLFLLLRISTEVDRRRSRNWRDLVEIPRTKNNKWRREFEKSVRMSDSFLFPIKFIDEP